MPRAPCVSPKQPLILRSVTLCAHQSGVGHGVTQQHCLFPASWPLDDRGCSRADPLAPPLVTSSISLLPRSPCSPATGAAGLSEQSAQEPVPREWSPGRPFSLHTLPTPECRPGLSTAGYLFPPSPYPACHPCTDGLERWIPWEEGTPVGFLFSTGEVRRHTVASSPHHGLPTGQEPLDLGWSQALLPPPSPPAWPHPQEGEGWPHTPSRLNLRAGRGGKKVRSPPTTTAFTQQPWRGVQEIKIVQLCLEPFSLSVRVGTWPRAPDS